MRWTVLIPAKSLPQAKSRLAPISADTAAHGRLVDAIRHDTVAAARSAEGVARVLLVVDRLVGPRPHDVLVQSAPGLNAGLAEAAALVSSRWADDGVAALVGDLPALRPGDLADALRAAAGHRRSFVADHSGIGTTMLAAVPGVELAPAFGVRSAERHAAAAVALAAEPGLRLDVDTADDLYAAAVLGLGPASAAELTSSKIEHRSPCAGIMRA